MTVSSEAFKRTLGLWASGVTVVTTANEGVLHGMTVSSFASVSLSPPLISVGLERSARCLEACRSSGVFGVSVLSEQQQEISNHFASRSETERLLGQSYAIGAGGCPLLDGAVAHLECGVYAIHPAGDHALVIGEVRHAAVFERSPLVYFSGAYGRFVT